ncbi:MAG: SMC-Scp complex subunit ScpB [Syntrophomonadaceae bacterium]|nr:SMC-Scp complex subunit ScpB [Syntrophomonadaceae bacterium]MDD3889576.1 SMC-Scp complex subunit ScpB [Syntrophomonadaceae bacterium]MDD4548644.1 SMC-Scp complex subunit ScpB [Syntrophomonadaceae bacterium]
MLMWDELKGSIEAILFMRSEPISLEELAHILETPVADLKLTLEEMIIEYNRSKRGIQIIYTASGYMMGTNPEYSNILVRMEKPVKRKLSQAAMEALAIIAYKQPVTRVEIEQIRGVKSDRIIYSLLEKGLIVEAGHKAVPGKPVLYTTTNEFLKVFGLPSLGELPVLEGE